MKEVNPFGTACRKQKYLLALLRPEEARMTPVGNPGSCAATAAETLLPTVCRRRFVPRRFSPLPVCRRCRAAPPSVTVLGLPPPLYQAAGYYCHRSAAASLQRFRVLLSLVCRRRAAPPIIVFIDLLQRPITFQYQQCKLQIWRKTAKYQICNAYIFPRILALPKSV